MLHQNQPQSRLILSRQVKDINTTYDQKKQLDNSMYYSKVRVNTDSSPKLHGLPGQKFLSPKGEQKLDQKQTSYQVKSTISPSSNLKTINYLEMIEKIKQQSCEEKHNLILVKFYQENEGQNKQTQIEKCQTLPASLTTQLVNNLMGCSSQLATESKVESERQSSVLKETTNLDSTKQGFFLNKDKSFEVDSYKLNEGKQNFSFLSKAKEEVIGFKEIRLSPHKHSYTESNLKIFESPVTARSYEESDFKFSNKRVQTPSFNRCSKQYEKNYPKLYDELYASSFQYPEYEDPILEKENRSEIVDEQPFQNQRENFISFAQNFSFRKETLFASSNFIIQDGSKATYFGDYFTKKELQNENRIKSQLSYIPTSDELKNNLTQSKILFVPLTSHTAQTPKTNLSQSLLQESRITLNSPQPNQYYPQYATYNSLMSPINYSSITQSKENVQSQLTLDNVAEPLSSPTNCQVNNFKDYAQSSTSNTKFSTSFVSSTLPITTPSSSQSSYTNSTLPLGLRDINIQQYLKSSTIPDYKPLTNQQSTLNYSKNPLVTCQNYLTNYLTGQKSNENYPLKSYLNTQTENEQIKHKKSYLNEKRENQQSSLLYTKL
ncbi:hypothetical protein TTHERM_01027580 (macronuclear) [Tetrahymena thermophila SB210]|uniref:Uncharacterized protein n=1 Tax=Tetrahymena thermophila (strain SB210) TaxID=312017 RepID=Q22CM0_TETTS|nr:hypothetical protein TTHERM_01027580 [Tetrahymena thermophila SB210]EAR83032.2 hypothetical protein TTHERM_01027580 [Tetrahymena thermophila SB210]|eukprot:XP_001030695.2 hypothetical protein TTHERM_01027580 [Tetrahymena thermophila SB210]